MNNDILMSENEENNFPTSSGGFGWDKNENEEYKYNNDFVSIVKDWPVDLYKTGLCRHIKDLKPHSEPQNNGYYTGVLPYVIETIGEDCYTASYQCLYCVLEAVKRFNIPDFDKL